MNFFTTLSADYSDIISSFSLPMIIGIFAFALPLLLQTAGRIDDKYNSTLLIKVFCKDWICKCFLGTLIVSLISILLWILQLPRFINCGYFINTLIDNSAMILLAISTVLLVISVLLAVWLTYVYYLPEKLLKRLKHQYKKAKNDTDKSAFFHAISSILLYSIKKEGEPLARNLQEFYWSEFIDFRKDKQGEDIVYPDYYYDVLFDANECLCQRERKNISLYNGSFFDFFVDEYQQTFISENTYTFLWKCIRQSIFYGKDEFVMSYWRKAHQYVSFWLDSIYPEYDDKFNIINKVEVDIRADKKKRFLDFHYALGGLLMKEKRYDLIQQMTSWSNVMPPRYNLVPETMTEVIHKFMEISSYERDFIYYEVRYPFPETQGVDANDIIKIWIKRYFAILFLRQYTLNEYYIYSKPLEMPNPPQRLSDKKRWNDELEILKYYVKDYLESTDVLKVLHMEKLLSKEWYKESGKVPPLELLDAYKEDIKNDAKITKQNQPIDIEKKKTFQNTAKEKLQETFLKTKNIFQIGESSYFPKFNFSGKNCILDKVAFASDSDVSYINEDTILPESIAKEFIVNIMNTFLLMQRTQYTIKDVDLFKAVDQLSLNKNDFLILNIGLSLKYYRDYLKVSGLIEDAQGWHYHNMDIVEAPFNHVLSHSFIVIRKKHLPLITFKDIDADTISKYNLELIDNDKKLYASLIDLNISNLRDEIQKETGISETEIKEKVLACINMNVVVSFHKEAECLHLKVYSQFEDKGNPDNIEEINTDWGKTINDSESDIKTNNKQKPSLKNSKTQPLNNS